MKVAATQQKTNSQKSSQKHKGKKKNKKRIMYPAVERKKSKPTPEEIKKMEIPDHLKNYPNIWSIRQCNPNFFLLLVNGQIKTKKEKKEESQKENMQCHICKKEDHLAKNCPIRALKKGKLPPEQLENVKCYRCHQLGHTSKTCQASPDDPQLSKKNTPQCYVCKEEGHLARNCSQRPAKKLKTEANKDGSSDQSAQGNSKTSDMVEVYAASSSPSKQPQNGQQAATNGKDKSAALTPVVAIDCEMVGVGDGGKESILARVSIVNQHGDCLYDKYVTPTEEVTDYRTAVSGIRPELLVNAPDLKTVQKEVAAILDKKILVGHSLKNDLKCLFLGHPKRKIRDTSKYKPFRELFKGKTPSLKNLTLRVLGGEIQTGEHNSVEDAQAAMMLYNRVRKDWERGIGKKKEKKPRGLLNQVL